MGFNTASASSSAFQDGFGRIALGLVLLLSSLPLYAQQGKKSPPVPVTVQTVAQQNIPVYDVYPGRTEAIKRVSVHARVAGILQKKFYRDGETVKQGQVLFKIDDRRYQALADQARAQVDMQQADLNQAQREYARVKGLYASKAVSEQELDQALSELELAKAALLGAQATLNNTLIDLEYTDVKAEISGVTGVKQQDVGSLVGSHADNSLLTTLTQLDPIHVVFAISDSQRVAQRNQIVQGQLTPLEQPQWKAEIVNPQNRIVAEGQVDFVGSEIDRETGSVVARARFENEKQTLIPGEFVRLRIYSAIRNQVFRIPQKAVVQMGQQSFVYVINSGKAELRPIKGLLPYQGDWLIESGLEDGEKVITSNLIKVRPDTAVQVIQPDTSGQSVP